MIMEKLTLEHLACYLPYGLKMWRSEKIWPLTGLNNRVGFQLLSFGPHELNPIGCKPILRPMDLTKPIIVDGNEVIPILELAKISRSASNLSIINGKCVDFGGMEFWNYNNDFCFRAEQYYSHASNQLDLFQWLFKHKFDVFGLIEKGLAIDVNTLENNPY